MQARQGWNWTWCLLLLVGIAGPMCAQQTRTFLNGMEASYLQDTTRSLLHMGIYLRGGASLDPPDAQGLAHLYEHLFFQYLPDSTPASKASDRGIFLSHKTMLEGQFFGMSLPASELPVALHLLAQGLSSNTWADSTLAQARAELAPELQALDDGPENHLASDVRSRTWGEDAHRMHAPGNYSDILQLDAARILAGISQYRHPRLCRILATGPMDGASFLREVETALGKWNPGPAPQVLPSVRFPDLREPIYFQTVNEFASQPLLMMAWPLDRIGDSTLDARMRMFCAAAQLKRSPLQRQLVDQGLAQGYTWTYAGGINPGQLLLYVVPVKQRLGECLAALHRVLAEMGQAGGFGKADITAALRQASLEAALGHDQSVPRLLQWADGLVLPSPNAVQSDAMLTQLQATARQLMGGQAYVAGLLINSSDQYALGTDTIFQPPTGAVATVVTLKGDDGQGGVQDVRPALLTNEELGKLRVSFEDEAGRTLATDNKLLEEIAKMLKAHPSTRIYLNSYSEGLGDGVRNYQLSVTRAKAVRQRMVEEFGVAMQQVVIRAYGEAFPEFVDDRDLRNRRLTFDYAPTDAQDNAF